MNVEADGAVVFMAIEELAELHGLSSLMARIEMMQPGGSPDRRQRRLPTSDLSNVAILTGGRLL